MDKSSNNNSTIQQHISFRQGPLPSPEEFRKYEEICPGAADRILKMAEEQGVHRRELEKIVVKSDSRDSLWGLIFAFVFAMTAVFYGANLILSDHSVAGTIFGGVGLIAVVNAFIKGRNNVADGESTKEKN